MMKPWTNVDAVKTKEIGLQESLHAMSAAYGIIGNVSSLFAVLTSETLNETLCHGIVKNV